MTLTKEAKLELIKKHGRRRRFLTYLQKHDLEGYRALIKELGLRR